MVSGKRTELWEKTERRGGKKITLIMIKDPLHPSTNQWQDCEPLEAISENNGQLHGPFHWTAVVVVVVIFFLLYFLFFLLSCTLAGRPLAVGET